VYSQENLYCARALRIGNLDPVHRIFGID